jgi:hypothetical protein
MISLPYAPLRLTITIPLASTVARLGTGPGSAANPTGTLNTSTYCGTSIRRANFPCPEWTYSNKTEGGTGRVKRVNE